MSRKESRALVDPVRITCASLVNLTEGMGRLAPARHVRYHTDGEWRRMPLCAAVWTHPGRAVHLVAPRRGGKGQTLMARTTLKASISRSVADVVTQKG